MSKAASVSSNLGSEKDHSATKLGYDDVDVAARLAGGGYEETISAEDAVRIRLMKFLDFLFIPS